ncbi:hypothetical protein ACF068_25625 [Streptomyces sp. NPDC016309]|uniref:hypothetical protein n=1 Tax=Streptomyces sp. NPDC016309 TaxID=3364965 RepID=UPI0036F7E9A3
MTASLIISMIALTVTMANLTWQLALYLLNGPRLQVRMTVGAIGAGGMVTMPVENVRNLDETFRSFAQQGYSQPVLAVEVVNLGRLGVELLDFGVDVSKGASLKPLKDAVTETPMPYVLEPHRQGTWAIPFEYVVRLNEASRAAWPNEPHPIRAFVHRAGGKKVHAKQTLSLDLR